MLRHFLVMNGFDFEDREPDFTMPAPKMQRFANLNRFLTYDAPAVRRYRLDLPALRAAVAGRIVPAAGRSSEAFFPHHCARELAREPGRPLGLFVGGHSGPYLRPRAFAERLGEILMSAGR